MGNAWKGKIALWKKIKKKCKQYQYFSDLKKMRVSLGEVDKVSMEQSAVSFEQTWKPGSKNYHKIVVLDHVHEPKFWHTWCAWTNTKKYYNMPYVSHSDVPYNFS